MIGIHRLYSYVPTFFWMVNSRGKSMASLRCARNKSESSSHGSMRSVNMRTNGESLDDYEPSPNLRVYKRVKKLLRCNSGFSKCRIAIYSFVCNMCYLYFPIIKYTLVFAFCIPFTIDMGYLFCCFASRWKPSLPKCRMKKLVWLWRTLKACGQKYPVFLLVRSILSVMLSLLKRW